MRAEAPERLDAILGLARIALLDDRVAEARLHAERAVELAPDLETPRALLAEAAYRGRDFSRAAECYQELGRPGMAAKAARLSQIEAYGLLPHSGTARLPLLAGGMPPVIRARIDGRDANLLVDTAARELLVDRTSPGASRIPLTGTERVAFAGGRTANVEHALVGALELGGLSLAQVPCQVLDLTAPLAPFLEMPIHGVLGLEVLRRFAVELDLRARELRLSWPASQTPPAERGQRLWLAAGHYLVAAGRLGDDGRHGMLLLDTGMSGVDCMMARSIAEGAATPTDPALDIAGQGGGGTVRGLGVRVSRVCLGELCRADARAAVLPHLALSRQLGFQLAALLACDFFRETVLTLDFHRMELALRS